MQTLIDATFLESLFLMAKIIFPIVLILILSVPAAILTILLGVGVIILAIFILAPIESFFVEKFRWLFRFLDKIFKKFSKLLAKIRSHKIDAL